MQLHFSPSRLPPCALTIGNFDGVHRGHLALLQTLKQHAQMRKLPTALLTFEALPLEVLRRESAPPRLMSLRDRIRYIEQTGCIDHLIVQKFTPNFAAQDAETFIKKKLIDAYQTRFLMIGDDFHFGAGRRGNFELLAQYPQFELKALPTTCEGSERISSTAIRHALKLGDISKATQLLGHDYTISGRVIHGKKLGRTLGFPTANITPFPYRPALSGVFVVDAQTPFGRLKGAASLGLNPSIPNATPRYQLEIYFLNFSGNLYGQRLNIRFLHHLRPEAKFANLDALRTQIHDDVAQTQLFFEHFDALPNSAS